jgi:hypothetical protein
MPYATDGGMTDAPAPTDAKPPFDACPRCTYSLRGLPVDHYCPECGLRFDRDCELYRVTNPKQFLLIWGLIFGGGWINLRALRYWDSWATESLWHKIYAVAGLIWIICLIFGVFWIRKMYMRGQRVAVTVDGLFIQMATGDDGLIPWSHVCDAKAGMKGKAHIAKVKRRDPDKTIRLGDIYTLFRTEKDAQRFADQINARLTPQAACATGSQ